MLEPCRITFSAQWVRSTTAKCAATCPCRSWPGELIISSHGGLVLTAYDAAKCLDKLQELFGDEEHLSSLLLAWAVQEAERRACCYFPSHTIGCDSGHLEPQLFLLPVQMQPSLAPPCSCSACVCGGRFGICSVHWHCTSLLLPTGRHPCEGCRPLSTPSRVFVCAHLRHELRRWPPGSEPHCAHHEAALVRSPCCVHLRNLKVPTASRRF